MFDSSPSSVCLTTFYFNQNKIRPYSKIVSDHQKLHEAEGMEFQELHGSKMVTILLKY